MLITKYVNSYSRHPILLIMHVINYCSKLCLCVNTVKLFLVQQHYFWTLICDQKSELSNCHSRCYLHLQPNSISQ